MPANPPQVVKKLAVRHVKPRVPAAWWEAATSRPGAAAKRVAEMNLNQLAQHFGTDKWGRHRYTQHYEHYFGKWRDEQFTMLEIGIGGYNREGEGGASLKMWKTFFRRAQVIGLDIEDKRFLEQDRIKIYVGSQVDADLLHEMNDESGPFRLIVDDGSHRPEHIRRTFEILFPLLELGGFYVIEDTQTSYWPNWGGSEDFDDPTTTIALIKSLLDGLHHEEFLPTTEHEPSYSDRHVVAVHAFHNMVIIEKGLNNEKSQWIERKRKAAAAAARRKRRREAKAAAANAAAAT